MKLSSSHHAHILLILIVFSASVSADAQHMSMHTRQQNIFLLLMDTMMMKMDATVIGVSPEHDFIEQMIPHHVGAIEMAVYEIQHGKRFSMIQLAKSILAEQSGEVQQMKLYIKQLPSGKTEPRKGFKEDMDSTMEVMMKNMPDNTKLTDVDFAFASVMIPHHQAAIDMAKVVLKFSKDLQTIAFAKQIISTQEVEIEQMFSFLREIKS